MTQFPKYIHGDCVTVPEADRGPVSGFIVNLKHVQVDGRERKPSRINTRYDEYRLITFI